MASEECEITKGIKILDIAYPRLRAPDLDLVEEFFIEFGMVRAVRTDTALYMRGTGSAHHLHITEKGEPGFVSMAYYARSEADLHKIAGHPDAISGVQDIDEPGGGQRVLLKEPNNGFVIEIVFGIATVPELPIVYRTPRYNEEVMKTIGNLKRLQLGPAHIRRISHGVFATPVLRPTMTWFRDALGLLCTDEFYVDSPDNMVGAFYRLDRGDEPVDHHVINCYYNKTAGFQHASFVVENVEDLMIGHTHLMSLNRYTHMRGVGYHPPGGQIFDYWLNPAGQMHELYVPTQRFTASDPSNFMPFPGKTAINRTNAFADNITEPVDVDYHD